MRKFALLIANSEYTDDGFSRLLKSQADVEGLRDVLANPAIGGFTDVKILSDRTFAEVRIKISEFFADRERDDTVLLYFSGHGALDHRGNLYLVVHDTLRRSLNATGISADFVNTEMEMCSARRQVLVLDCCYSGAVARGVKSGVGNPAVTEATFKASGFGKTILTASSATQYAFEGNELLGEARNSLFTYHLIEALRTGDGDEVGDGQITVDEWFEYAAQQVRNMSPDQTPRKWVYNQEGLSIVIAKNPVINQSSKRFERLLTWEGKDVTLTEWRQTKPLNINCVTEDVNTLNNLVIKGDSKTALIALCNSIGRDAMCAYIDLLQAYNELSEENSLRYHYYKRLSWWLPFIYPRLYSLRQLLGEDGVLFVNVDDFHLHYARCVLDEIFGLDNYLCTVVWKRGTTPFDHGGSRGALDSHEFIVCYSRGPGFSFAGELHTPDESMYRNPDDDLRGPWIGESLLGGSSPIERPQLIYSLTHPVTGITISPTPKRVWRYSLERMQGLESEGRIYWPSNGLPRKKRYLSEIKTRNRPFSTIIEGPTYYEGRHQLKDLLGEDVSISAKPTSLIKTLLRQVADKDFVVIDCFGGSGEIAQAVLELNKEDNGNRRFIVIEPNENITGNVIRLRIEKYWAKENASSGIKPFRFCTVT